jgi:hypothetical protein
MTNLSPLVNTRGPIFTHPDGIVLRPVYHVCDLYRSQPAGVSISRTSVTATDDSCRVPLRPHSVNILRLETADAER